MTLREFFSEDFAGDLEYHPRRAALYLILGYWVFSPSETRFTVIPLVFALGSLTLFVKGVFLLRKSSEGLGLSEQELAKLSGSAARKRLRRSDWGSQPIETMQTRWLAFNSTPSIPGSGPGQKSRQQPSFAHQRTRSTVRKSHR